MYQLEPINNQQKNIRFQHEPAAFTCARSSGFQNLLLQKYPKARPINDCLVWIVAAARLFGERFFTWLGMAAMVTVISTVIFLAADYFVPQWSLNKVWQPLAGCCFVGGLITAAASWAEEDDLKLSYLFSGFQYKFFDLFILYLLTGMIVGMPLLALYTFSPEIVSMASEHLTATPTVLATVFLMSAFALVILWFAPALIVLHDIRPWTAMYKSVQASFSNMLTLFIFSMMVGLAAYGIYQTFPMWLPKMMDGLGYDMTITLLAFVASLCIVFIALVFYVSYRNVWTNLELE